MHALAFTENVRAAIAERVGSEQVVRMQLSIGKQHGMVPDGCARRHSVAAH